MGSTISCVVIKSDLFSRRIPAPGDLVRVAGKSGQFVVMQVDRARRVAQLMEKSGRHQLMQVPLASVRIFNRKLAQAIHRFLDSRTEGS